MSEWWTYRPSDFLLFSPRTYYRLFELYNTQIWPAQLPALGLGLAVVLVLASARGRAGGATGASGARAACTMLAACWLWVAWAFHLQRYAAINWAATWFAAGFAIEGAFLLLGAGLASRTGIAAGAGAAGTVGLALLVFALVGQPWLGPLLGRPWSQAEVFGLAPDPTALGTLGLLLQLRPAGAAHGAGSTRVLAYMLWPIPLAWCLVSGATLGVMGAPDALVMPGAALLAALVAWRCGRGGERGLPSG